MRLTKHLRGGKGERRGEGSLLTLYQKKNISTIMRQTATITDPILVEATSYLGAFELNCPTSLGLARWKNELSSHTD